MPLKVAYFTHHVDLYGANRSLIELVLELRDRGAVHPLVVVPGEGAVAERLRTHGIECRPVPFQKWMEERRYEGHWYRRFGQWIGYRRAARARNRANAQLVPTLSEQLRTAGIDLLHANSSAVPLAEPIAQVLEVPWVQHVREMPERHYGLHLDRGRHAHGRTLAAADRVIAVSQAIADDVYRYASDAQVRVIHNGVVPQRRYAELRERAEARWASASPFTFAMMGFIHPQKGYEEALQALALVRKRHPAVRLLVAGGGHEEWLRDMVSRHGLADSVELLGFTDGPFDLLARSHALLVCARDEAMGRVTVEAFAAGIPVIGHASGGTAELVQRGVHGYLYDQGPGALAERMTALIEHPEQARSMGMRASLDAEHRFTIERSADQVLNTYHTVLDHHGK